MTPEMNKNGEDGPSTDLWALGVMALELFVGQSIQNSGQDFFGTNIMQVLEELSDGEYEIPKEIDDDAADFIRQLTRVNPRERLGFTEETQEASMKKLKAHQLFKDYNWERKDIPFDADTMLWFEKHKPEFVKFDEFDKIWNEKYKTGKFGDICLVERHERIFVRKELQRGKILDADMSRNIKNSISVLEKLYKCEQVINLFAHIDEPEQDSHFLFLDYAQNGKI